MLDERGVEDCNPPTGGFTRVELGYQIQNDSVADFVCVIWLVRDDGQVLAEARLPVSQYAQVGSSQRGASGTIRYDIPEIPLLDGGYSVNIELQGRRDGATYDHLNHAVRFHVVDKGGRGGLIDPGGVWSVVPTEQPVVGWPDQFIEHGKLEELREKYGLTAEAALEKARPYLVAMESRRMVLR